MKQAGLMADYNFQLTLYIENDITRVKHLDVFQIFSPITSPPLSWLTNGFPVICVNAFSNVGSTVSPSETQRRERSWKVICPSEFYLAQFQRSFQRA